MPPVPSATRPRRVLITVTTVLAVLGGLLVAVGQPATAAPAARTFTAPIEPLARYEGQSTCDPTEKPGTVALRALVTATYPGVNRGGISRACDVGGRSEHKEGRAWDWMLDASDPVQKARAEDFLTWLLATDDQGNRHAMARRLGVMYVIWDAKVWEAYDAAAGWKPYTGWSPHTDHIHVSLSWPGALKQTSFWGTPSTTPVPTPTATPLPTASPTPTTSPAPSPTASPTPTVVPAPFGSLDAVAAEGQGLRVRGWAIDADASTFTSVALTVDGVAARTVVADLHHEPLVTLQPRYTPRHGFDALLPASPGTRTVCATALDQNAGDDVRLGCRTATVAALPAPTPVPAAPSPSPVTPSPAPTTTTSVLPPPVRLVDHSCPTGRIPATSFSDTVATVHRPAIDCLVWWAVATGSTPTAYQPERAVTRAQMATFLARTVLASGGELPADPPDAFTDDEGSGSHERAIDQLAAVGISKGLGGGRYDPNGTVTRGQMATFLAQAFAHRTLRVLPAGADYFTDDDGSAHEAAIGRVARAGFTGGTAVARFTPDAPTDRAQMATFLARMLDLLVEAGHARPAPVT